MRIKSIFQYCKEPVVIIIGHAEDGRVDFLFISSRTHFELHSFQLTVIYPLVRYLCEVKPPLGYVVLIMSMQAYSPILTRRRPDLLFFSRLPLISFTLMSSFYFVAIWSTSPKYVHRTNTSSIRIRICLSVLLKFVRISVNAYFLWVLEALFLYFYIYFYFYIFRHLLSITASGPWTKTRQRSFKVGKAKLNWYPRMQIDISEHNYAIPVSRL